MFNNIHNFVNTADLVPKVAMSEWGFIHYGQDHLFHAAPNDVEGGYQTTEAAINAELKVLNSDVTYNVSELTPTRLSSAASNALSLESTDSADAVDSLGLAGDAQGVPSMPEVLLDVVTEMS